MRYKDGKASETVGYEQRGYIGFRYDAPNLALDTKRDTLLLLNIDAILKASTSKARSSWVSSPSNQAQHALHLPVTAISMMAAVTGSDSDSL